MNDVLVRALKTLVQSAAGMAAAAALVAIGDNNIISDVGWRYVAESAALAAVVSILMNINKIYGGE